MILAAPAPPQTASTTTDPARGFRLVLWIHAALTTVGSLLHSSWHWLIPTLPGAPAPGTPIADGLALLNLAIAIFLGFLAVSSVWLARSKSFALVHLRGFTALFGGIWIGRLALELTLPVQAPLLGPHTSTILTVALVGVLALLAAPELRLRLTR